MESFVEPSALLGITLKISKKVMPKHHQCHVVCWPMTRRKRGRRRIPASWRNVVMHFRTKPSASTRPYMAIASGARGFVDQTKSEAHWHGIVRSMFHGSGWHCVETKNMPNWFTQKWERNMKYIETCTYNSLSYIRHFFTIMAIYIHGFLMLTGCHFPGPATHNLAEPFGDLLVCRKRRRITVAMVGNFWKSLGWFKFGVTILFWLGFVFSWHVINESIGCPHGINQPGSMNPVKRFPFARRILLKPPPRLTRHALHTVTDPQ